MFCGCLVGSTQLEVLPNARLPWGQRAVTKPAPLHATSLGRMPFSVGSAWSPQTVARQAVRVVSP